MPIRMDRKRKRTRVGTAAVVLSVALLGGAGYNLTRSGTELIAIYLTVVALGLLGLGISQLSKAAHGR